MANNLYDTGAPKRVIVVNSTPAPDIVAQAQRDSLDAMDRLWRNFIAYCAGRAVRNDPAPAPREAYRAGPAAIEASYEVLPPRQLAPPKNPKEK